MIAGVESENGSRDADHAPFRNSLPSVGWHLRRSAYLSNLKCLISPQYEDMKGDKHVENEVVWGSLGSSKVSGHSTIRQSVYEFLLA